MDGPVSAPRLKRKWNTRQEHSDLLRLDWTGLAWYTHLTCWCWCWCTRCCVLMGPPGSVIRRLPQRVDEELRPSSSHAPVQQWKRARRRRPAPTPGQSDCQGRDARPPTCRLIAP